MGIDLVAAEKEQNWTGRRRITNLMDTTFVMTPRKWWGDAIIHEIIYWSAFVGDDARGVKTIAEGKGAEGGSESCTRTEGSHSAVEKGRVQPRPSAWLCPNPTPSSTNNILLCCPFPPGVLRTRKKGEGVLGDGQSAHRVRPNPLVFSYADDDGSSILRILEPAGNTMLMISVKRISLGGCRFALLRSKWRQCVTCFIKIDTVQQKTNRNRRKRPLTMLFKHKQNTATTTLPEVNCVPVAECFDIDAMCKDAKFTNFFTFNYVDDNKIAVYCRQKVFKMREAKVYGDFFVFAEGVVVFWDVGRRSQAFIGNILSKYQHNPFGDQLKKDEEETMAIDFTSGSSYASNDVVFLNSERHHRQLNAGESAGSSNSEWAFGSKRLMKLDDKVQGCIDGMKNRNDRWWRFLKRNGIPWDHKKALQMIGCFADLRHTVNSTDLLSKDVYWDLPEIESAYGSLARRLCLQSRRNWVNERLGHCEYFSKTISEALNTEHSHFLEVVIILLIAFECAHVATNWLGLGGQEVRAKVVHRAHQNGHEVNDVLMEDVEEAGEGTSAQQQTFGSDQNRRLAFIQTTARIKEELRKAEQGQTSGQTIEKLFEQVHRSNVDIDNVDNFRTLCRGSEALDQLIQLSVSQVEGMKDETAHSFDPGKLVARLKSFAIAHRKTEDKDHFTTIGRHFNFLLRKTPNFSYLRPCYEMKADGPHLREKTQRKRTTQPVKEETQIVQGKTLTEMGEAAAAASTADDGTGGSSTAVNKELDNVRRHLKRVYKQNGTDAVDYYRFVLHPNSFGETVRLRVDPCTGLASIVKLSHEEREERRCVERSKTQTVPRLDYDTWRRMVCELKIDKPYITRRVQ
uniref:DUF155 domain-containing protein n=1 Tax=Globodera rostochiensis TaxID=31243 RepID=A0A914GRS5_GLORO